MILDHLLSFFSHDMGFDLGSANLKIFVKNKGVVVNEPIVIARHRKTKKIIAAGFEAKQMIGRVAPSVEIIHPIKNGVVSDFDVLSYIIKIHVEKLHRSYGLIPKVPKPRVIVPVSSDFSEVERKAAVDVLRAGGARQVILVSKIMTAAAGIGFGVSKSGAMIVNLGASTTEMGVVSGAGIILSKNMRQGGSQMDEAIVNFIRLKYGVLIGEQSAEAIKIAVGFLPNLKNASFEKFTVVRGRDLESGLPRSLRISSNEISETLMPLVNRIIDQLKEIIEKTPPEFLGDISDAGIALLGKASLTRGLTDLITETTKMRAWVAKDPGLAVVRGAGMGLSNGKMLRKMLI